MKMCLTDLVLHLLQYRPAKARQRTRQRMQQVRPRFRRNHQAEYFASENHFTPVVVMC